MFINERLLDSLAYGFSGGPQWRTRVTPLRNRIDRRNIESTRPQHEFSGSFDRKEKEVVAYLLAVFNACAGAAYAFRFRNYLDYEVMDQLLVTASGLQQSVQLVKTYSWGPISRDVPIRLPDEVNLMANGVPLAHTVGPGGVVVFTGLPGDIITWSGTYDLPVRFTSDEFSGTMESFDATTVDVQLIEDLSV